MTDVSTYQHHPIVEEIVDYLSLRIDNGDRKFFRIVVVYYMAIMAASMRTKIITQDRGEVPVNTYALALATTGSGKGYSTTLMEESFLDGFRQRFVEESMPELAEDRIFQLATERAVRKGTEQDEELKELRREYEQTGAFPFVFDEASTPAIKQVRQKLLMAGSGSLNLQVDEIGSNLEKVTEALHTYLELYDKGLVKAKLTKNSHDNKRTEEIVGTTPANLLLFGTPSRLLDGGATEDRFFSLLDTGYARRCIFAMGNHVPVSDDMSAAELFNSLADTSSHVPVAKWAAHFTSLADPNKFNWALTMPDELSVELIQYRIDCKKRAKEMPEFEEIRKAEMEHRYFKAMKVAGTLAFIDEAFDIEQKHLHAAIRLVEESGDAFQKLLTREKAYMKLARYIAESDAELTHADLDENLPFYKSGQGWRNDMMNLATAWGYKNHIMIKKTFADGIEFFTGETLEKTRLDRMILSLSDDFAYNYEAATPTFAQLERLAKAPGMHWANHCFEDEHRQEVNAIPGFNMVVLDIDGGTTLSTVHELLKDHTFITYTTKRHGQDGKDRFRLILPTNYVLKLDADDYKEFMGNVLEWMPMEIKVDETTQQRSRKWLTNPNCDFFLNEGTKLLDILPFVPKTSKNEAHHATMKELQSLDNLERWFAQRIARGDRNNQMIKFALCLADSGMPYSEIESKVLSFNARMKESLDPEELRSTVLVTVAKKLQAAAP